MNDHLFRRLSRAEIADLIPEAAADDELELVVHDPLAYVTRFSFVWPQRDVTVDFVIDEATIQTPSYETNDPLRHGLAQKYREGVRLGEAKSSHV